MQEMIYLYDTVKPQIQKDWFIRVPNFDRPKDSIPQVYPAASTGSIDTAKVKVSVRVP